MAEGIVRCHPDVRDPVRDAGGRDDIAWSAFSGAGEDDPAALLDAISRAKNRAVAHFARASWSACHAAAAEIDGRLVVIIGASGSGKSTLSVLLASRGHAVADELVMLRRAAGGVELAAPALPLMLPRSVLRQLSAARHWRVGPEELPNGKVMLVPPGFLSTPGPVAVLFLLQREGPATGRAMRRAGCRETAECLMAGLLRYPGTGQAPLRRRSWEVLCSLLDLVPAWSLGVRLPADASAAVSAVEEATERSAACASLSR